jgi:hypothetical protein
LPIRSLVETTANLVESTLELGSLSANLKLDQGGLDGRKQLVGGKGASQIVSGPSLDQCRGDFEVFFFRKQEELGEFIRSTDDLQDSFGASFEEISPRKNYEPEGLFTQDSANPRQGGCLLNGVTTLGNRVLESFEILGGGVGQ